MMSWEAAFYHQPETNERAKEILEHFPDYPSIPLVSEYLERTGRGNLLNDYPYDPTYWSRASIESALFHDLEKDGLDRSGLRKCLTTNYLKPSMSDRSKRIRPPLYLGEMKERCLEQLSAAETERNIFSAANDDMAEVFQEKAAHWRKLLNYFSSLTAGDRAELDESDMAFLEEEIIRRAGNPFGNGNENRPAKDLKRLAYAAYIKRYFPDVYIAKQPPKPVSLRG